MSYTFWSNVGIDVETAKAAPKTITAITKASPAVVTSAAHGYSNGDYVVLAVLGMFQLNAVVARVAGQTTDTFQLEGIDSTGFETFTSGTAEKLTFGASMTNVVDVNVSGGEPEFQDITTIHQNIRTRVPVVTSPLSFSMTGLFDPSDAAMQELADATRSITQRCMRFRFANGTKMVFQGYPSASGVPTGTAQGPVNTPISIEAQGVPTVYST
jgi:hypothetical protein